MKKTCCGTSKKRTI